MDALTRKVREGSRTHYAGNLLSQVPESAQSWAATLPGAVLGQPDADAVQARMWHALDALEAKFPKAAGHLVAAQHDLLALTVFPREIWCLIWSNNLWERNLRDRPAHRTHGTHRTRDHGRAECRRPADRRRRVGEDHGGVQARGAGERGEERGWIPHRNRRIGAM
ncbi:transposase [Streptomyces broussonetiae]|uniref:transposase n=1 Tax=Streptomyces broussonetiae TaxID=2686304 RepID=UPI0035DE5631